MALDLNDSYNKAKTKVSAVQTVIETKKNQALLKKQKAKSSLDEAQKKVTKQINELEGNVNNLKNEIKSNVKNQLEQLLDLFKQSLPKTENKSLSTIVRFFLEAVNNTKSKMKEELITEIISTIGCSEEQSYSDIVAGANVGSSNQSIYVKVSQVDLFKRLQLSPDDEDAKFFYEKEENTPGSLPFSLNRQLYKRLQTAQSLQTEYGTGLLGESGQDLFDVNYVTSYVTPTGTVYGDFFEVNLKQQLNNRTTVSDFLRDYYNSIEVIDFNTLAADLMNALNPSLDFSLKITSDEMREQKKFDLILKRIMGICSPPPQKIDVQGTAKLSETDTIDDSFFEVSGQELRNIENEINNTINGVVEFEDCGDLKLPLNVKATRESLDEVIKENKDSKKIDKVLEAIDNMTKDPEWKNLVPKFGLDLNLKLNIETDLIKKLPRIVFRNILSPKVVLGFLTMIKAIKNELSFTNSPAVIDDLFDDINGFMKVFKKFTVNYMQKITSIFVQELFTIVKKNIKQLVETILTDILKEAKNKQIAMYSSIVYILLIVGQAFLDYRDCKSIIDELLKLLNLGLSQLNIGLPQFVLAGSALLGGVSETRTLSNVIQNLQEAGLPTGDAPDGEPNLFNIALFSTIKGITKENAENGKTEVFIPPLTITPAGITLPSKGYGKSY
jgi:hypothetical protein